LEYDRFLAFFISLVLFHKLSTKLDHSVNFDISFTLSNAFKNSVFEILFLSETNQILVILFPIYINHIHHKSVETIYCVCLDKKLSKKLQSLKYQYVAENHRSLLKVLSHKVFEIFAICQLAST
jgi:hypothetical protein